MINKEICKKCFQKHEVSETIKKIPELTWETFDLFPCPKGGFVSFVKEDSLPENCYYFLEQTLNQKKSK